MRWAKPGESHAPRSTSATRADRSSLPTGVWWLFPPGIRRQTSGPVDRKSAEEQPFGRHPSPSGECRVGMTRPPFLAHDVSSPAGKYQSETVPGDRVNQVVVVESDHGQAAHWGIRPVGAGVGVDEIWREVGEAVRGRDCRDVSRIPAIGGRIVGAQQGPARFGNPEQARHRRFSRDLPGLSRGGIAPVGRDEAAIDQHQRPVPHPKRGQHPVAGTEFSRGRHLRFTVVQEDAPNAHVPVFVVGGRDHGPILPAGCCDGWCVDARTDPLDQSELPRPPFQLPGAQCRQHGEDKRRRDAQADKGCE
jgi:hypothetical protein